MPYSKNHTEKTLEEQMEQACRQLLQTGARVEEAYKDLLELYTLAGNTAEGLAKIIYNTETPTAEQTAFASDAVATGSALNAVITALSNNADALRRFS